MPVQSTKTTTIPGLAAPATPDLIAYGLNINPKFQSAGISASANIQIIPYRANSDGTDPLPVGQKSFANIPDVFAAATPAASLPAPVASAITALVAALAAITDDTAFPTALAAAVAILGPAVQAYVNANGL